MSKPIAHLLALLTALAALLLAPSLAGPAPQDEGLDFEALAKAFATDHGLDGLDEWDVDFRAVLDQGYAHVALGIFDVYYPVSGLEDGKNAAMFQELCGLLLEVQKLWLESMQPHVGKLREPLDDLEDVQKWVAKWKTSALRKIDPEESLDLADQLKTSDRQREAIARLQASFLEGDGLGIEREGALSSPLILLPTREEFVRLMCYAGLIYEHDRDAYWTDETHTWIEGRISDMRALALEYTDPVHPLDITRGRDMNIKHDDELQQHVVQRAYLSLLQNYFGEHLDPAVAVGLAINTDIDVFGKDHARLEGDPRGNSTPPREVFVPGGNPNGGYLPPLSAESHWREFEGEFRFVTKLQQAQKAGNETGQDSREKLRSFALKDAEAGQYIVHAPFLGTPAFDKGMPPELYVGEYMEFFRAYRTGFAHFLRTGAGKNERESKELFGQLMVAMAQANLTYDDQRSFEELIQDIYGVPLSSAEPDTKTDLEGRFIKWLDKQ